MQPDRKLESIYDKISRRWKIVVYFFLVILISGLLAFAYLLQNIVSDVDELRWREFRSAYDVEMEYKWFSVFGGLRIKLIQKGWDQESLLISSLKWLQGIFYESALNKIPPADGEHSVWQRMYKIGPRMAAKDTSPEFISAMFQNLDDLMQKKFASRDMRIFERTAIAAAHMFYYFDSEPKLAVSTELEYKYRRTLITTGVSLLKGIEEKDSSIFRSRFDSDEKIVPLFLAYFTSLYVAREIREKHYGCSPSEIENINVLFEKIPAWETYFHSLNVELTEKIGAVFNALKQRYNMDRPEVTRFLKEECKVNF